jgi:ketosteroid isomerase-like protein
MSKAETGKNSDLSLLMKRYTDAILAKDIASWVKLWADDGVFEHPYSPPGYKKQVVGKQAIAEYMSGFPDRFDVREFNLVGLIQNEEGTEAFTEITCKATALTTGRPYNQHYVGFMRVNEAGKLVLYRDFWNPLVAIETFGGAEALMDAFAAQGN